MIQTHGPEAKYIGNQLESLNRFRLKTSNKIRTSDWTPILTLILLKLLFDSTPSIGIILHEETNR